jgi:D-glycero-D-manno-heptose 1,7-bisphosphate phosphatase
MSSARWYALLDRDGTLVTGLPYLSSPADVELLPGAAEGLRALRRAGIGTSIVTNQSGIGRGLFGAAELDATNSRLVDLLRAEGAEIDAIYVCPHTPEDGCTCRKPEAGLVLQAASENRFDPTRSIVIGDNECDIELGARLGAKTVLVRTGYGAEVERKGRVAPDFVIDDLGQIESVLGRLGATAEVVAG